MAYRLCMQTTLFLDKVSWRKMRQEMLYHLESSASSMKNIQALLEPEKHTSAFPLFPHHTRHVEDRPLEIISHYRNWISVSLVYVRSIMWTLISSSWPRLSHQHGDSLVHLPLPTLMAWTHEWGSVNLGHGFMPLPLKQKWGLCSVRAGVGKTPSFIHPPIHSEFYFPSSYSTIPPEKADSAQHKERPGK